MPLNRLDNFIKNTEGRILYVNPNDLDSTDSIENQGNALARPFKTIQRAILEAARFSYVKGNKNDLIEKTTILLFPGEHLVDNRPGYAIYNNSGSPFAVPRSGGTGLLASNVLSLDANSVFDLNQEDNILYKFNSFYGGVIVPRGTSIVGFDVRKTKIRPKYVPNPTDFTAANSAIFRLTGGSHFAQVTFFDADEKILAYTNPDASDLTYQSTPTFSHHKLSCFEFCDGVNEVDCYGLTDLDMYYAKVSNAYNTYRNIDQKFPTSEAGFVKRDPEWEIVGDFASDPVEIVNIFSGNGLTASALVTVTTAVPHELNEGTAIKIKGVSGPGLVTPYNISTTVQNILSSTQFTYLLPALGSYLTLNPNPNDLTSATVIVETDTVSGSSPYIFNCNLRSAWGMNGLIADGYKASGFKSTVVAQFTGVSLQKDDRAFVKYDPVSRTYQGISYGVSYGSDLTAGAASLDSTKIYHLDSEAVYRKDWESSHIKAVNDAFIQVSSVFAIGFNKQFDVESGADQSITNSNSNFGQFALSATGFKREAFSKDNKAFITSIIAPKSIDIYRESKIEWLQIDVGLTTSVGISSHIYIYGFDSADDPPPAQAQGHRIGGMPGDILYFVGPSNILPSEVTYSAKIYMCDNEIGTGSTIAQGTISAVKSYDVTGQPSSNSFTIGPNKLITGEKVKIISADGDLPENIEDHSTYYVINNNDNNTIKLASTYTEAIQGDALNVYKGANLSILSRVTDKDAGDLGSPIQFDPVYNNWFIHVDPINEIYPALFTGGIAVFESSTDLTFVNRVLDRRKQEDKVYKFRVVIPKEYKNARDPQTGFILQETSTTGVRNDTDFTRTSIGRTDYDYNKNPRFISTCSVSSSTVTVISELPHNLQINDIVIIKNVKSSNNTEAEENVGFNGAFTVSSIVDANTFRHSVIDIFGIVHDPGSFTNNTSVRNVNLPRFEKNDISKNFYIYKNEIISPYVYNKQDGVYHLYVLNASNAMNVEFTDLEFSQVVTDLYPQIDRDDINDNPPAAKTFAKRFPIGEVVSNDRKKSITRETTDIALKSFGMGLDVTSVSSVSTASTITFSRFHGLSGIVTGTITPGATYNPTSGIQTYHNVKLLNTSQTGTWNGATARVVVNNGSVTNVSIVSPGSGYSAGDLYFDQTRIGAGNGAARYTITTAGISTNIGDVVQFTGDGTSSDTYHRITSVPSSTSIAIAKTSGDSAINSNQYAFVVGPSVIISSSTYDSPTGISTFTTSSAHGLLAGNRFRVLNSSNNNLGDYIVKSRVSVTTFNAVTQKSLSVSNGYILKHGLSSNNADSDYIKENIGIRGVSGYDGESFTLTSAITTQTTLSITGNSSTALRIPLGSYIQIDEEIMRVSSVNSDTSIGVIRGVLATRQENHDSNSLIRKIHPIPVEFRRPSIIRASSHTFEYLGYGPGNYSTSLPQVQVREITDRENFLAQSQERSAGVVAYSGMNNEGEFFFGNTKTSSMSGDSISYDAPNQTVAGDDSTRRRLLLPVDEITVSEKIVVEGGPNNAIFSLFEGPVVFDNQTRFNDTVTVNAQLRVIPGVESTSTKTGDVVVYGGVGIGKNLYVGGLGRFVNETESNSCSTGAVVVSGGVGIAKNLNVCGDAQISGITTILGRNGTDSSTKNNGSLVVEGGVGIEKSVNIGGNINVTGFGTINEGLNINTNGAPIGDLYSSGGSDFDFGIRNTSTNGTISFHVKDGVGAGTYNDILSITSSVATVDGRLLVLSNQSSTSTGSGAVVVTGGVGIGGNLYVGGIIAGNLQYSVSDGAGLTGGSFNNSGNITINMGTPGTITNTSTNSTTATSHTHEFNPAGIDISQFAGGNDVVTAVNNISPYQVRAWGKIINGTSKTTVTIEGAPGYGEPGPGGCYLAKTAQQGNPVTNETVIDSSGGDQKGKYTVYFSSQLPSSNYAITFGIGDAKDHVCSVEYQAGHAFVFRTFDAGSGNNEGDPTPTIYFTVTY